MERALWIVGLALLTGCGGGGGDQTPSTTDGDDGTGACGEIHSADMVISGTVKVDGVLTQGIDVWLEERNWAPITEHGAGVTDENGAFEIMATDLPIVEECWGTAVQFYMVAADSQGHEDEDPVNSSIIAAWTTDSDEVDLSRPLEIYTY